MKLQWLPQISHKLLGESSSNEVRFYLCTVLVVSFLSPPPTLLFLDFNICLLTHKRIQTRSVSSKWVPAHLTKRAWELGEKKASTRSIFHIEIQIKSKLFGKLGQNWGTSFHQGQLKCQKIIYKHNCNGIWHKTSPVQIMCIWVQLYLPAELPLILCLVSVTFVNRNI